MTGADADLLRARDAVERFVRARTQEDPDDVVQEALTRLLEHADRLAEAAWPTYAVIVAGRLLRDRERARDIRDRRGHLAAEPARSADPLAVLVSAEEHAALRRAVAHLPEEDDRLLRRHYVERDEQRSRARGTTSRLARARAKLRVAYLLELTALELPTTRCRPVLEALSTGDRRRQERTGAARHLGACRTCSSYAVPLLDRRRQSAGLHPLAWVSALGSTAWAVLRERPVQSAAAAGGGVVLMAGAALASSVAAPQPGLPDRIDTLATAAPSRLAAPTSMVTAGGRPLSPLPGRLPLGAPVLASTALVLAVPADEGFWIDTGTGDRFWVQLMTADESAVAVRAGSRVSFDGTLRAVPPGFADRVGLSPAEGGAALEQLGAYISVARNSIVVR